MITARLNVDDLKRRLGACGDAARCPAHDDKTASLSISAGEGGRVLLHCHAGCTFSEICAAMGLKPSELMAGSPDSAFDDSHDAIRSRKKTHHLSREKAIEAACWGARRSVQDDSIEVAAVYAYGADICVTRMSNKDFRPVHRNGAGWLVGKPEAYPLYRQDVVESAGAETFIFFTEGEKDADNLVEAGLVATTMAGGVNGIVSNLKAADLSPLRGREVVLLPDNDKPGRDCMENVAEILAGVAGGTRTCHLPGLPEKGDVSDWLEAGGGAEELVRLAELAQVSVRAAKGRTKRRAERRLVLRAGNSIDDGGMRYLWRRRIPIGGSTIIFSRPGAGKSTLAADLAGHVTRGKPWPDGAPCEQGHVIYVKGEGTDASIRDRMQNAGADPGRYHVIGRADVDEESDQSPMIDLASDDANLLAHEIQMIGDVKLVIVDTLDACTPACG